MGTRVGGGGRGQEPWDKGRGWEQAAHASRRDLLALFLIISVHTVNRQK